MAVLVIFFLNWYAIVDGIMNEGMNYVNTTTYITNTAFLIELRSSQFVNVDAHRDTETAYTCCQQETTS